MISIKGQCNLSILDVSVLKHCSHELHSYYGMHNNVTFITDTENGARFIKTERSLNSDLCT